LIVADTNLIAYMLIAGTRTPQARKVWAADNRWVMPPLWRSEFLNVLATAVRAGVIDAAEALIGWRNSLHLFRNCEVEPEGEAVLMAAEKYGISAYDAQFVVVAEKMKARLVTSDRRLLKSCRGIAVSMDDFG
jgi:predicted nucleic acid-binding protein